MEQKTPAITDTLDPLSASELRQVVLGLADFEASDLNQLNSALNNVNEMLNTLKDKPNTTSFTESLNTLKTELTDLQEHLEFGASECGGTCHSPVEEVATSEATNIFSTTQVDFGTPDIKTVNVGEKTMDEAILPIYLNDMFESIADMKALSETGDTLNNTSPESDIASKIQAVKSAYKAYDPEGKNAALNQRVEDTTNTLETLIETNKQQGAERSEELESYFTR